MAGEGRGGVYEGSGLRGEIEGAELTYQRTFFKTYVMLESGLDRDSKRLSSSLATKTVRCGTGKLYVEEAGFVLVQGWLKLQVLKHLLGQLE